MGVQSDCQVLLAFCPSNTSVASIALVTSGDLTMGRRSLIT